MSLDEARDYDQQKRYISREEEEKLIERLYTQSLQSKQEALAQLEARYYPVEEEKKITKEELQKSVNRQYDDELQRRKVNFAESEKNAYAKYDKEKTKTVTVLTKEEIDASVERMYNDTLKKKELNMQESQKKYLFDREKEAPTVKKDKKELQEYFEKISKPKKQKYTTEEINKVYGLSNANAS